MQGVEANTATTRIIDGRCQKVIEIHQHGGHHYEIGPFPILSKKQGDHDGRNDKVQGEM